MPPRYSATCVVGGCGEDFHALGYCRRHYQLDYRSIHASDTTPQELDGETYLRERGRVSDGQLARAFAVSLKRGAPDHLLGLALRLFVELEAR